MNGQKDLGRAVAEAIAIGAVTYIVTPYIIAGIGKALDGASMIGQGVTNVVKDQMDKRKKVKVEEVEED